MKRHAPLSLALVLAGASLALASCGSAGDATGGTLDGVGRIPGNDFVGVATLPPNIAADVSIPAVKGAIIGSVAKGNRVLMIGDSILSSIAKRYGNEACSLLVPQGWAIAIEAEAGQFAEFGSTVLSRRWNEGWDAVVVELGTNYDGSKTRYRTAMEKILEKVSPTPVLILNTTEFRSRQAEVNEIIEELVAANPNATLLDWRSISAARSVRSNDGIHPSPEGRVVLATAIARAMGIAPTSPGDCLKSYFQDDSRVLRDVMPASSVPNQTTIPVADPAQTTVPSVATSTTVAPATSVAPTTAPAVSVAPTTTPVPTESTVTASTVTG
jgi:hypothetical protein